MRRTLGVVTALIAAALLLAGCPLPGENPKPVPTYTPAPAWSWPYGQSPKALAEAPVTTTAAVTFTWPKPTTTPVRKRVIEVVDRIGPAKWNVRQAMNWLDRYTASDMRLVSKCSGRAWRCVTLRGGKLPRNYLGVTEGNRITIDTVKVDRNGYRSNLSREKILAHELFHTFGYAHSSSGRNLMRPKMSQIRLWLTTGQRRYLAAR
jgi:hypothetical protein